MLPNSSPNPSARRRSSVALSSRCARRHARRDAPRLGQLSEHVQVGDARQAVGAERHVDVHRVERLERRRHRRRRSVAARARRPASSPSAAARARSSPSNCTPWTTSTPRSRKPRSDEIRDRRRPAAASRRSRRRARSSSTRARPVPSAANSTSSADSPRCTVVTAPGCASTSARIAGNSAGDTEYGACGARLTRTPPLVDARRLCRARGLADACRRVGVTEAEQLVEHLRRHRRLTQQRHGDERVADVADQPGAAWRARARWPSRAASTIARSAGIGILAPQRHQLPSPSH